MTDIKDERLSQLIAQIHSAPSPEEAFSKWMFIDIFIIDGLMMAFVFLFVILRDMTVMVMIGSGSIAFGAVYLYLKNEAKKRESLGKNFLDSQTIIGDMELAEQIGIEGYEYIVLPEATMDGNAISYQRIDLDEVAQALATPFIRFGGESTLRPSVIDRLVEIRLMELKEEAERRAKERIEKMEAKAIKAEKGKIEDVGEEETTTDLIMSLRKKSRFTRIREKFGFRRKRIRKIGDASGEKMAPASVSVEEEESTGSIFAPMKRSEDDNHA